MNRVLGADIRSFFDSLDHKWLLKMPAHGSPIHYPPAYQAVTPMVVAVEQLRLVHGRVVQPPQVHRHPKN
jgi:hypothetical protein